MATPSLCRLLGCLPSSESSSPAAVVNLFWLSSTLGTGLAMLGTYTPSSPQKRKGLGARAATVIGWEMPRTRSEGAKLGRMDTPQVDDCL